MTIRTTLTRIGRHDGLNFVVTNYIPRRLASWCVGRISRSENRLVAAVSLWTWRCFTDIDLADAECSRFNSMHDCFTRRLKPGARPIDPDNAVLTSPCDAIVGAVGTVTQGQALQVKGMEYALADLLDDAAHAASLEGGCFVTLRLTSAMYHRFHALQDCLVTQVRHVFGDRWNVNPPTLRRVSRLFCRNERVAIRTILSPGGENVTMVAVAAVLVSGIRLGFLDLAPIGRRSIRQNYICDAWMTKGREMGWFEHGSTIIVIAQDPLKLANGVEEGRLIRMGQPLLSLLQEPLPVGDGE